MREGLERLERQRLITVLMVEEGVKYGKGEMRDERWEAKR